MGCCDASQRQQRRLGNASSDDFDQISWKSYVFKQISTNSGCWIFVEILIKCWGLCLGFAYVRLYLCWNYVETVGTFWVVDSGVGMLKLIISWGNLLKSWTIVEFVKRILRYLLSFCGFCWSVVEIVLVLLKLCWNYVIVSEVVSWSFVKRILRYLLSFCGFCWITVEILLVLLKLCWNYVEVSEVVL